MNAFLLKDYELKVGFLEHHFEALWRRFGLFLAIQSGILVVLFHAERPQHLVNLFCGLGAGASLIWTCVGLRDRDLVRQFRGHLEQAKREYEKAQQMGENYLLPPDYPHPGQTVSTPAAAAFAALKPSLSIAAMSVWVPIVVAGAWGCLRVLL